MSRTVINASDEGRLKIFRYRHRDNMCYIDSVGWDERDAWSNVIHIVLDPVDWIYVKWFFIVDMDKMTVVDEVR